jgi:hypothetical protein
VAARRGKFAAEQGETAGEGRISRVPRIRLHCRPRTATTDSFL